MAMSLLDACKKKKKLVIMRKFHRLKYMSTCTSVLFTTCFRPELEAKSSSSW